MIGRFLLKFFVAGAACAMPLAFLLLVLQMVGALDYSLSMVGGLSLLVGVVAGLGYAVLDWFSGFIPGKQKQRGEGGRDGDSA